MDTYTQHRYRYCRYCRYRERNGLTLCVKLLGFAEEMEEDLAGLDQKVGCSVLD